MPSKNPNNHDSRLVGDKGISNKVKPLSVKLPNEIDEILRAIAFPLEKSRSDYLREAIINKMFLDGHISEEMAKRSLSPQNPRTRKKKKPAPQLGQAQLKDKFN